MKEVSVRDAREQLSRILKAVERGEEVSILRRGRPVARVVRPLGDPPRFRSRADLRQSLPAMRETAVDTVRTLRDSERY
ncbi:Prevent-host-death protein [Thioalkalivibrio nitratireducens DSM 14787]|uniref:Antitoxin n=1 Tax=Thioalkalivibrio nitratireducens (strain DSM 14787 / UNIQEM 213 / ALEN2) TaxID=1255043 RepID=L0DVQ6_THIND|nr:type II toxin-antitoxin system Phd/YefM family antitoxin [Thioalkalivibrio nitratireducens]AGA32411.1 Prevent-host-death protein [Thioalkalivibrio nitratireducens DSM 14787]